MDKKYPLFDFLMSQLDVEIQAFFREHPEECRRISHKDLLAMQLNRAMKELTEAVRSLRVDEGTP